jgi:N-hydroxyarylamine O-acetyltransferase
MMDAERLAEYFDRVRYTDAPGPHIDCLSALHLLHPQQIPFENIDQITGQPGSLDLSVIIEKLVCKARGGWCYEQNQLFGAVLEQIGFTVEGRLARVMWNRPLGAVAPPLHFVLAVSWPGSGSYLADVGFGGLTLTAPIRLDADGVQPTPHEDFRVRREGDDHVVEAHVSREWKPLYKVGQAKVEICDLAVCDFFHRNSKEAPFARSLAVARVVGQERRTLHNHRLKLYADARERCLAVGERELLVTLKAQFGIALEPDEAADLLRVFKTLADLP